MITSIAFDTPIGTEYKRNNRSTRQKSLRCFPSCGAKGHVTGGFCGRPLKVVVELVREHNSLDIKIEDYRFIAEIRPLNQPGISKLKSLSEEDLQRQLRGRYDRNEFNGEIFQADTANILSIGSKMAEVELTFNSSHCSWDYSWKSNRWSGPQELHVVDIIVLRSVSVNEVRVISSALSSSFMISSSHKKPVKANRIKEEEEEEEDEYAVEMTEASGMSAKARAARSEERAGTRSTRSSSGATSSAVVTKVIPEDIADVRGSYTGPTRQLKMSEDGKSISFLAETRTSTEESVNEGALALIQLLGVSGGQPGFPLPPPSSSAAASVASAYYGIPQMPPVVLPKRGEKRAHPQPQSEASGAADDNDVDADKSHATEKATVPPGFPYPHYPFAYPGYPPHGYPPYPYPYPYPYGMPPPGAKKDEATEEKSAPAPRKRGKKDDGTAAAAAVLEKATASSSQLPPQYPPYHHPMYPPHMFPYPPPPHMGGPGGAAPTYPAMTMYGYPPPPYALPPSTASLKCGAQPGASSVPPGMPGGYPMPPFDPHNPYAHLMHHMGMPSYPPMHMPYGMPYPPLPGYGAGPAKTAAEPGSTSTSDSEADSDDKDKEKGGASATTPLPSALLPACGSAEKVVPVAVPIGATAAQIPSKLASLTLPKRGTGAATTGVDAPSIQESRPDTARLSVYDILAERAREREKLRVSSASTSAAQSSTTRSER